MCSNCRICFVPSSTEKKIPLLWVYRSTVYWEGKKARFSINLFAISIPMKRNFGGVCGGCLRPLCMNIISMQKQTCTLFFLSFGIQSVKRFRYLIASEGDRIHESFCLYSFDIVVAWLFLCQIKCNHILRCCRRRNTIQGSSINTGYGYCACQFHKQHIYYSFFSLHFSFHQLQFNHNS